MKKIPPHILYPGMILFILMGSVLANIILIIRATSDQGPQIINDYYAQSANYNATIDEREETERLGWQAKVITHRPENATTRKIDFIVLDANNAPLKGATGNVELYNPAKANMLGHADLVPVNDGLYTVTIQGEKVNRKGLYDIVLHLQHDGSHFVKKLRERM